MEEAYLAYSTLPPSLYIIGGFCAALPLTAITLPPNAESRMQLRVFPTPVLPVPIKWPCTLPSGTTVINSSIKIKLGMCPSALVPFCMPFRRASVMPAEGKMLPALCFLRFRCLSEPEVPSFWKSLLLAYCT